MNAELNGLLKQVSRSFYLTLRVLPGAIRPQIGLAYLLARTTDTIADTEIVPVAQRLRSLADLRARISGERAERVDFGELAKHQGAPAERVLLEKVEAALSILHGLDQEDAARVRQVLEIITSGQELDLQRFAGATPEKPVALETGAELDDYTYRVAGCVGKFWTHMCRSHLFPKARLDDAFLLGNGVRFGKGLQLVNILRDLPSDLRIGRCYLPAQELAKLGLAPADLLNPANESRLRPLYDRYLVLAQEHLRAGWAYTNALPPNCRRVRLACAWPILIGDQTLAKLRTGRVLDPARRIKVSRKEVRGIMARSIIYYPFANTWRGLFRNGEY